MFDGDLLCRFFFTPRNFPSGYFDISTVFKFILSEDKTELRLSLSSKFLLENIDNIHSKGCESAAVNNEKDRANGNLFVKETGNTCYHGFYEIYAYVLKNSPLKPCGLRHKPLDGNDAHFEYYISKQEGTSNKRSLRDAFTIGEFLTDRMMGPQRYARPLLEKIKTGGFDDIQKKGEIELPDRPYIDFTEDLEALRYKPPRLAPGI